MVSTMPFRFVYRTADISALYRCLKSADYTSAVLYTSVNGIVKLTIMYTIFLLLSTVYLV